MNPSEGGEAALEQPVQELPPKKQMYKDFIAIAWPASVEGALMSIIGSMDTMMVGKLGTAAISAVGLVAQPRMIMLILAQALCVGTTAIIARRKGADDRKGANRAFGMSFAIITLIGVIITVLGQIGAPWLMNLAGANEDTMELSITYFRIISWGFMFNCWTMCICAAQRAVGKTKITLSTNLTANIVNVCLNYCLIGGHFGFPALGVAGAAIATAIGTFVGCCIAIAAILPREGYLRFSFRNVFSFDRQTLQSIAKVGGSSIAESVFLRLGFLINSKLIAGIGTDAFASYQIVSQVTSLSFTLGDGLATGGATLVGQSLGAGRKDLAKENVKLARRLSIYVSIALMVIVVLLHRRLGMLFSEDEKILEGVSIAFFVAAVGFLPQNGRVVYSGCLRGAGDTRYVAICSLVSVVFIRTILTWVLSYPLNELLPGLRLDVAGPWAAFVIDAFIRNYMYVARIKRDKWLDIKL